MLSPASAPFVNTLLLAESPLISEPEEAVVILTVLPDEASAAPYIPVITNNLCEFELGVIFTDKPVISVKVPTPIKS